MSEMEPTPGDVLFNPRILASVDCSQCSFVVKNGLSPNNPGDGLVLRPLQKADYSNGFITLLSQLTQVGEYTREKFDKQFDAMKQVSGVYYIVVIEDTRVGREKLVATATLVVERKFIHGAASRGRIEDVVVLGEYRGLYLGSILVELLTALSKQLGCYKTTLDCKADKIQFYEKYGFARESQALMVQRFFD
eukprot:Em0012g974a